MIQLRELINDEFHIVAIGTTNVGKSTLLNNITQMKGFFNTSAARETSSLWRFQMIKDEKQAEAPIVLREYIFHEEK